MYVKDLTAAFAIVVATLIAQSPPSIPRTPEGKPDFSGIYEWPKDVLGERGGGPATVFDRRKFAPFKPGGEPFLEPRTGDPRHDEPRDFACRRVFPADALRRAPFASFQNKNFLVMAHEFQGMTRSIPLDGHPHRNGLEPSFYGDPVGIGKATRWWSKRPTSSAGLLTITSIRIRKNIGCTATP